MRHGCSRRAPEHRRVKLLGLTGGIGMGKSTAAAAFRRAGLPVFDADAAVHRLQAPGGGAVRAVAAAFPGTGRGTGLPGPRAHGLDRAELRRQVLADPAALRRLEAIMHPLVRAEQRRFVARARRAGRPAVVLDIPLLFETGGDRAVDLAIVVSAPPSVQLARVRQRRRMTDEQIRAILRQQMPDSAKRRRADHLIPTGLSRFHAQRRVRQIVRALRMGVGR